MGILISVTYDQWWEQESKCQDQDQDSEPTDQDTSK